MCAHVAGDNTANTYKGTPTTRTIPHFSLAICVLLAICARRLHQRRNPRRKSITFLPSIRAGALKALLKADFDQVAATNRDFMSTCPNRSWNTAASRSQTSKLVNHHAPKRADAAHSNNELLTAPLPPCGPCSRSPKPHKRLRPDHGAAPGAGCARRGNIAHVAMVARSLARAADFPPLDVWDLYGGRWRSAQREPEPKTGQPAQTRRSTRVSHCVEGGAYRTSAHSAFKL